MTASACVSWLWALRESGGSDTQQWQARLQFDPRTALHLEEPGLRGETAAPGLGPGKNRMSLEHSLLQKAGMCSLHAADTAEHGGQLWALGQTAALSASSSPGHWVYITARDTSGLGWDMVGQGPPGTLWGSLEVVEHMGVHLIPRLHCLLDASRLCHLNTSDWVPFPCTLPNPALFSHASQAHPQTCRCAWEPGSCLVLTARTPTGLLKIYYL